jgi:hypothetical protein
MNLPMCLSEAIKEVSYTVMSMMIYRRNTQTILRRNSQTFEAEWNLSRNLASVCPVLIFLSKQFRLTYALLASGFLLWFVVNEELICDVR